MFGQGRVIAWGSDVFRQTDVPAGLSSVVAVAAGRFSGLVKREKSAFAQSNGLDVLSLIEISENSYHAKVCVDFRGCRAESCSV